MYKSESNILSHENVDIFHMFVQIKATRVQFKVRQCKNGIESHYASRAHPLSDNAGSQLTSNSHIKPS